MIELDQAQPSVQPHVTTADQAQQLLADLEQYVEYYQDGLLSDEELADATERLLYRPYSAAELVTAR